jgi:hypothetical protein
MAVGADAVFVVDRDGEVMVFVTVGDAVAQLEAVDVEAGEYAVFGSGGQVLDVRALGDHVEIVDTGRCDLEGIRRRVRVHCERVGCASDPDDLVAVANELLRREWEARWPRWPRWPRWLAVRLRGAVPPQARGSGVPDGER